jgi:hypothetical protein
MIVLAGTSKRTGIPSYNSEAYLLIGGYLVVSGTLFVLSSYLLFGFVVVIAIIVTRVSAVVVVVVVGGGGITVFHLDRLCEDGWTFWQDVLGFHLDCIAFAVVVIGWFGVGFSFDGSRSVVGPIDGGFIFTHS